MQKFAFYYAYETMHAPIIAALAPRVHFLLRKKPEECGVSAINENR
jgi:hypothetical protein